MLLKPVAIFLMGPTASGKTQLAMALYNVLPVEIISVDSALIYRGMDIGTAKPSLMERKLTPHRLIDICDPNHKYSAADFCVDALREMDEVVKRGKIPLLVGGTMLYFKALLEGLSPLPPANHEIRTEIEQKAAQQGWINIHNQLSKVDPESAAKIHPNDPQRLTRALEVFLISGKTLSELTKAKGVELPYNVRQFIIVPENRIILHQRIEKRFHEMLESDFENEVIRLIARRDLNLNMPSMRCVGYRQMWSYLHNNYSYDEMIFRSICATRQLAKRQITWLNKWHNATVLGNEIDHALQHIEKVVSA